MKKHKVRVYIKRLSDGAIRVYRDWVREDEDGLSDWDWSDGNNSCDCNRHIYFEGEYCEAECGDQELYKVVVKSQETSEIIYSEYDL
jgi:hypothetical protein